jgi:3-phenylpropionate/trans-cinnamate dioxygenase ferredoxin subunit
MEYVKVAETSALPAGKMMLVTAGGKKMLLANVEGAYYAIANECTHLRGSLVGGTLEGSIVTCPRHHAQFDVKTGRAVSEAKIAFVKMKVRDEVKYEVKVEGNDVLIGIP